MPAATPPHKQGQLLADAADRVAMLTLAVGGHEAFAVSTIEVDRGGVSYTVDTLAVLAERHPHDTLALLLGPDALAQFPTWREPRTIADRYELVAVERERLDDVPPLVDMMLDRMATQMGIPRPQITDDDRVDREARFEVHARGAENRWKLIKLLTK